MIYSPVGGHRSAPQFSQPCWEKHKYEDKNKSLTMNRGIQIHRTRVTALRSYASANQCSFCVHTFCDLDLWPPGTKIKSVPLWVQVKVCTKFEDFPSSWSQDITFKKDINILCEATVTLIFHLWPWRTATTRKHKNTPSTYRDKTRYHNNLHTIKQSKDMSWRTRLLNAKTSIQSTKLSCIPFK